MQNSNKDPKYLGKKYGRLTVIGFSKKQKKGGGWNWIVKCDCGNEKTVNPSDVKSGEIKSCGCFRNERSSERAKKFEHNVYKYRRLYGIYNGVKRRCFNKKESRFKDYGGRGITMCEEWLNSENGFDKFVDWALSHGYTDGLTLERKNVDGDYCPENCEWITIVDQAKNKRDTLWVDYKGEHIRLLELCEREGVKYDTVHNRIYKQGWTVERAIHQQSQQENSLMKKCKDAGVNYSTVRDRIVKLGWEEKRALSTPTVGRGANVKTYGGDYGNGICAVCGKPFKRNNGKQIYCGAECRQISKSVSYRSLRSDQNKNK